MSEHPSQARPTRRAIFEWVGVVSRRPDPYVARMTWLALIADHRLRPIESFATPNPFTGGAVDGVLRMARREDAHAGEDQTPPRKPPRRPE